MKWTQPICEECYNKRSGGQTPIKLIEPNTEQCCDCGKETKEGIYFRVDPRTVKFPAKE